MYVNNSSWFNLCIYCKSWLWWIKWFDCGSLCALLKLVELDVKCWQRSGLPCLDAPSVGSALAVETGGSLFCSAALKSCNDRFSAVFSRTRGPVIRAPFPTRSILIDPWERRVCVYVCARVWVSMYVWRASARVLSRWECSSRTRLVTDRWEEIVNLWKNKEDVAVIQSRGGRRSESQIAHWLYTF